MLPNTRVRYLLNSCLHYCSCPHCITSRMVHLGNDCRLVELCQVLHMPRLLLTSGSTMPIMPRKSASAPICVASATICPECCHMLITPTWYQHIASMYDSIALGHSCLLESSIYPILQGVFNKCRWSHVLTLRHTIPGTMLPVGARPPLCHASSGSEVVHILYLCRFSPCDHELQVCRVPGHSEEVLMTKLSLQPLSPHPASAVHSSRCCRFNGWPEVAEEAFPTHASSSSTNTWPILPWAKSKQICGYPCRAPV